MRNGMNYTVGALATVRLAVSFMGYSIFYTLLFKIFMILNKKHRLRAADSVILEIKIIEPRLIEFLTHLRCRKTAALQTAPPRGMPFSENRAVF